MYEVRSTHGLTGDILAAEGPAEAAAAGTPAAARADSVPSPVAIVGIHGISPIQQYAFQDQLATGMLGYLNALEAEKQSGHTWFASVYWPRIVCSDKEVELKPSALRLYRDDERTPDAPTTPVYDVYEGYWSPYSKHKTNVVSLLRWLLGITFLGTSSTARIPAPWPKLLWDFGYIVGALAIALILLALAFVAGSFAWNEFAGLFLAGDPAQVPPFWRFAFDPLRQIQLLPWFAWFQLALDVVVAYVAVQLVVVLRARARTSRRTRELRKDARPNGRFYGQTIRAAAFHRVATIVLVVLLAVLAAVDAVLLWHFHPNAAWPILWHGAWLIAAVALLQGARAIGGFVVDNLLGDVQVYTTHDSNAAFYAIRGQIIDSVGKALRGPLDAVDITRTDAAGNAVPLYEKVHVAGHSLGSAVGLDALIRLRQLVYERAVTEEAWSRVRSFTTFGAALEKTRFFFDVRKPTVSAAQQQWQNDVYGRYFTLDRATLAQKDNRNGIFWSNHWYFRDPVANRIVSFESDITAGAAFSDWRQAPGAHPICEDNEIPHPAPPWAFVHGDYLADPTFWKNAGPVFTG
jgi:hypothetical protein